MPATISSPHRFSVLASEKLSLLRRKRLNDRVLVQAAENGRSRGRYRPRAAEALRASPCNAAISAVLRRVTGRELHGAAHSTEAGKPKLADIYSLQTGPGSYAARPELFLGSFPACLRFHPPARDFCISGVNLDSYKLPADCLRGHERGAGAAKWV